MRNDMFKVIVERPRRGVGYFRQLPNEYRAAKRFKLVEDDEVIDDFCGRVVPMRARRLGYDSKELNENLQPLRRYLEKQAGRPWNDVYSEICKNLDTGSTVKQHVRQHLTDFVTLKTFYDEDGDLWSVTCWGFKFGTYNDLWVDPEGILRKYQPVKRKSWRERQAEEDRKTHRVIDGVEYKKNDKGLWFRIERTEKQEVQRFFDYNTKTSYTREVKVVKMRKWSVNKKEIQTLKLYES